MAGRGEAVATKRFALCSVALGQMQPRLQTSKQNLGLCVCVSPPPQWVLSIDLAENQEASANVVVQMGDSFVEQAEQVKKNQKRDPGF